MKGEGASDEFFDPTPSRGKLGNDPLAMRLSRQKTASLRCVRTRLALVRHRKTRLDVRLRGQTGHQADIAEGPGLTHSGHERAAFAAMHGPDLPYLIRDP